MSEPIEILDWMHLPVGAVEHTLWSSLHDGDLQKMESNTLARTLTLQFDVPYVRSFNNLPDDTRFQFVLSHVASGRTTRWFAWPGNFSIPQGTPYEESSRMVKEFQEKGREESDSWTEFELGLNAERFTAEVIEATLATNQHQNSALKLGLLLGSGDWRELFVRFGPLEITVSDGTLLSLEEFLRLGESYWEDFAARKKTQLSNT